VDRRRAAGSAAPVRIGFDVSQTGAGKAGCGYFAEGLIQALESLGGGNEYFLYPAFGDLFWDPQCATAAYRTDHPAFHRLPAPGSFEESQRFWRNPGDDFEARIGNPEIVHSNNFFCPRGLRRARLVYTLHDLSFLVDPTWSTEANRVGCLDGVFRAATSADWIVANSDFTRRHFLEIFPHYPAERTAFIHAGSRFSFDRPAPAGVPERFGQLIPGKFWFSVGSLEPRKNHRRLLEAYEQSRLRPNQPDWPLVLAGGKGWLMEDLEAERRRGIVAAGYVSERELEWLYRNCFAFLYPSLFEGFGMPALEAMALGVPVICSNTTSLPEVVGDAGLLVDPLDAEAIAAAMVRLASGAVDREVLRAAGLRQARRFSWESSGRKLLEVYADCANRGKGF
jgi:glycosyltransferase involved in cell wall biosynthesis